MLIPFHRYWLRNRWVVAGLVAAAITMQAQCWQRVAAIQRETAMKLELSTRLEQLIQATDAIAAAHKKP